ncbi:hypothetical protein ES703_56194 [subsurface metagenome]
MPGKNGDKEELQQEAEIHPKDLLGPVNDTRDSVTAYASLHGMSIEAATSLFILDELRRIHWGVDELLGRIGLKEKADATGKRDS